MVDANTDYSSNDERIDLDAVVAAQTDFKKLVLGYRASGTALPYPDHWFDAYISNLCLQLISDPQAQIKEAYRVLKPGSRACFTVWGHKERSLMFTLAPMAQKNVLKNKGLPVPEEETVKTNFDVARDIKDFEAYFKQTGFNQVKYWYQPMNLHFRNGSDFMARSPLKDRFPDDKEVLAEMERLYDELSGKDSPDLRTFENMVILAYKD